MAPLKTPFGTFRGKHGDGVIQYLGIKYAHLSDQLSAPLMAAYYHGIFNAENYGPRPPAIDASLFEQQHLLQKVIDDTPSPPMSGTECLNLNITVPAIETERKLPVMVFIHGGGFLMGSNSLPHWDPARLVKLVADEGAPLIVVRINYRLGVLGNLTSEELRLQGYPGNNSLRDQRCAFQWIKTYIHGFGGDPDNITALGVSAGSASVITHLLQPTPLFKRAIAMSGTPIMLKPLTPSAAEAAYQSTISVLGLEKASVEERIQHLTSISPEELVEKTSKITSLIPFMEGDLIPEAMTFKGLGVGTDVGMKMPGGGWCDEIIIGDCQHDGNVFFFMGLAKRASNLASALYTSFSASLGLPTATAVLLPYGIFPDTPDDAAMEAAVCFATDFSYYAPAITFAQSFSYSFPGKVYVYHFNEPNPWEGQFNDLSTHYLDAAFLFQNFNKHLPPASVEVARTMAKKFIAFANGTRPWKEFDNVGEAVQVFRGDGLNTGRRHTFRALKEDGKVDFDRVSRAWDAFLAGK